MRSGCVLTRIRNGDLVWCYALAIRIIRKTTGRPWEGWRKRERRFGFRTLDFTQRDVVGFLMHSVHFLLL